MLLACEGQGNIRYVTTTIHPPGRTQPLDRDIAHQAPDWGDSQHQAHRTTLDAATDVLCKETEGDVH